MAGENEENRERAQYVQSEYALAIGGGADFVIDNVDGLDAEV